MVKRETMEKFTTIEKLRKTKWYKTSSDIIRQAIELLPPTQFYQFKDSGKQCFLISYEEPLSGKLKDVTVTVQKTGIGGVLNDDGIFSFMDKGWGVFGVKLNKLKPWVK